MGTSKDNSRSREEASARMLTKWRVLYLSSLIAGIGVLVLGLGWWRRKRPSRSQRFVTEGSSPITHVHSLRDPTGRRLDNGPGDSFGPGDFKITVLSTVPACEQHLECCLATPPKVIGLDCEWGGARGVPVALLQLAFPNKECALVHLSEVGCVVPKLAEILSDRSILKFGVGISNDAKRLQDGFNTPVAGCVDLQHLAVRCGFSHKGASLKTLAKVLLGKDLNKSRHITQSNWEASSLSDEQVTYAACDSIVALHIVKALVNWKANRIVEIDSPEPGTSASSFLSSKELGSLVGLCQGIVDVAFKGKGGGALIGSTLGQGGSSVRKKTAAYMTRQSPLYHNCQLLAPDGSLLSTVDKKKVEWYLQRGLATLVSQDPPKVQLIFEPRGRPGEDRQYYLEEKENICVVCGKERDCVRKNVVPHEYRQHFPSQMKEHLSHDVVLLCTTCHQMSSHHDGTFKRYLAEEYGAPLSGGQSRKYFDDPALLKAKNYAKALRKVDNKIPDQRKLQLMQSLAEHFNCTLDQVTMELIVEASEMDTRSKNNGFVSHGEAVVMKVQEQGKLVEFQKSWRKHFLDVMQPRHLPELWSVDHNPLT